LFFFILQEKNLLKLKRILVVFGTRPEAIKMAPLINELKKYNNEILVKVCVTGQHREMLDQVLSLFEISPDYDLNIMKSGQDLYDVTTRVLIGMRDVLSEVKPDLVLVHGDTSTSTASALASFYKKIPVGHVEAGLRTYDKYNPWPEEINRQITGKIASLHFAPTQVSRNNLINEGVDDSNVFVTGNTVIDALQLVINKLNKIPTLKVEIINSLEKFGIKRDYIEAWVNGQRKMVLITGHRRENFGLGFINICEAIKELAIIYHEVDFVYPMHLNPNVRNAIHKVFGLNDKSTRMQHNTYFIDPLEYLPFIYLMNISYLVLTDSGGIQEEAPGLGKPVLVMRNTTERPEAVTAGTVKLVGTDKQRIINEVKKLIENQNYYKSIALSKNPYGDGSASKKIKEAIMSK
jgi:UDP-N-acetylglucosamine 2-epimerase (non-hydrolysing)